ncbi:hypothetical protein [Frondihabitans sp. PAMC 28766]|uniref:hypothetical protein n=1 Tax=Frondihabitans sp. PAMC 28766 TaxID=1795630 RepID=UPI001EF401E8|nr:hypothetical protein [Frondihabitans sp. PAMC 28766]
MAETQGLIGSWLQSALRTGGLTKEVAVLVSSTMVDPDDPAFHTPTKFIGASFDESTAKRNVASFGWSVAQDGNAWRRVVASPRPVSVPATVLASHLLDAGHTVVLAGEVAFPLPAETVPTTSSRRSSTRTAPPPSSPRR